MLTLKKGDRVSEYILEEPLGRGGFGEVWRARHHLWDDRQVAVKVPTSPDAVRELSNEGNLQSSLDHPGIAKTLGMDPSADPPYFITEFVPGRNLRQLLEDDGPVSAEEARKILDQILEILSYAHGRGVVHQDIKPENVLRTEDGHVKLTDFGLGTTVNGESILLSASLRSAGVQGLGGTFPYIAPEIRDGHGEIDGRADLYSLGIVFFELLTGHRPAGGEVPSDIVKELPSWCDDVFRGLYTRRENRFKDVHSVRQKLASIEPQAATQQRKQKASTQRPKVTPVTPPLEKMPSREARKILGMSERQLEHRIKHGELTPYLVSGELYLATAEVRELSAKRAEGAPEAKKPQSDRRAQTTIPSDQHRPGGVFYRGVAMFTDLWIVAFAIGTVPIPISPLAVPLLYFSLAHGLYGQTLGKALLGLKVIRTNGDELNVFDGFIRTLVYGLSLLPMGLGFVCALFSNRKLAFHDIACGTRVIEVRKGTKGAPSKVA